MPQAPASTAEDLRQLEHLAPIGIAFLLPYIPYWAILALGGLAILHALVLSPRLIRVTTRQDEAQRRFSPGKLYYAVGVLFLLLLFHDRLYIVAGVWAILAVGDSASNFIGRRWGKRRLFYNPQKTLLGFLAFWILGGLAAWVLMWWNLPDRGLYSPAFLLLCAFLTALLCAIGESLPPVIDDNLAILWIGALSLAALQPVCPAEEVAGFAGPHISLSAALIVNLAAALLARLLGWISWRGSALAALLGILVAVALGWEAWAALLMFVVLGSLATRMGFAHKKKLKISEGEKGQRGIVSVAANGLVPALIALLALWSDYNLLLPFLAAVATAALDTVSTEIGQWLGRHPINPVTLRAVPVGTQGAVSVEGTLAGMAAALVIALVPFVLQPYPFIMIIPIWAGAVAGGFFESVNASLFRHKFDCSDEALNLYSTLFGATAAVCIAQVWGWVVM
ncbi:MAG: DUF92 domain-containing protein [Acidobacteriota bacterium]